MTITLTESLGVAKIKVDKHLAPLSKPPPISNSKIFCLLTPLVEISHLFAVAVSKTIPQFMVLQPKKTTLPISEVKKSNDLQVRFVNEVMMEGHRRVHGRNGFSCIFKHY